MKNEFDRIRKLVGEITPEQARYVDCFVSRVLGVFIPSVGPCYYSLSPQHTHPSYMFVLTSDNYSFLKIGDRTVQYESNKLYVVSPGVPHQEVPSEELSRYVAICVDRRFFERELAKYPGRRKADWAGESFEPPAALRGYLKEFMNEYENRAPGRAELMEAAALRITHALIRAILGVVPSNDGVESRFEVYRTIEYLHANYHRAVGVKEMAGASCMSPSHFHRKFKKETGKAPMEYLNQLRLDRARKLLLASAKPVTEIALQCGFNSPAYFASCFSRRFGITPVRFRKRLP